LWTGCAMKPRSFEGLSCCRAGLSWAAAGLHERSASMIALECTYSTDRRAAGGPARLPVFSSCI
jgi:hypothetical protein